MRRDLEHDVVGQQRLEQSPHAALRHVQVRGELLVQGWRAVELVHHLEHGRGDDHDMRHVLADRVVRGEAPKGELRVAPDGGEEVADVV